MPIQIGEKIVVKGTEYLIDEANKGLIEMLLNQEEKISELSVIKPVKNDRWSMVTTAVLKIAPDNDNVVSFKNVFEEMKKLSWNNKSEVHFILSRVSTILTVSGKQISFIIPKKSDI